MLGLVNWGLTAALTFANCGVIIWSKLTKDMTDYKAGRIIMSVTGVLQLFIGLAYILKNLKDSNHTKIIDTIVSPISIVAKPLALTKDPTATAGLVILDVVCGTLVGIARIKAVKV